MRCKRELVTLSTNLTLLLNFNPTNSFLCLISSSSSSLCCLTTFDFMGQNLLSVSKTKEDVADDDDRGRGGGDYFNQDSVCKRALL